MSNSGAGGGPAVISPVESLLFWKLQIVSFIFSRDGLAHCFSEGGVWQNTACGEFLRSIRQNLSEICLQPEKYLWIIGQKKLWNLNDEKKNVCKCTTFEWDWGSAESEALLSEIFSLPRIGDTGGVGWRGLDSYYYSIIIVNIIITLVTTSKRVIWDYENPLTIYRVVFLTGPP